MQAAWLYAITVWWHFEEHRINHVANSEELEELETGNEVDGTWGLYVMGEQMLYSENNQYHEGLSGFLALSSAPQNRNIITLMAAGGLSYQGLLPNRSNDTLALVFAYGLFSNDLARVERGNNQPVQDYEVILELNYRVQIAPWIFVQPDIQVVINPDGKKDIDDALVIGFAVGTVF